MAYKTYIDLVNAVRTRFNEPDLTTATFTATVGFDQFTKDAVNYAYHDILNSEMEWPFLHQVGSIKTTPGVQFYTLSPTPPSGFTSPAEIKTIDWDKFYISQNATQATITNEVDTIPSASPYTITVQNTTSWSSDLGVKYQSGGTALTPVIGDPLAGQYTIIAVNNSSQGTYVFNASDAGKAVEISYTTSVQAQASTITNTQFLQYIDYDFWVQNFLQSDMNSVEQDYALPNYVFKTQQYAELGISPVPDKIYQINYEYWLDGLDMTNTSDTTLLPSHFTQIILDGAQKYCYEFREDAQLAQLADARFKAGITRLRIETINRAYTMNAGFNWVRGTGYASPFVF
jgi:hypothetical protein